MTPQQIIESLKALGIELASDQGNLKVRSTKEKIKDEQRSLIAANKSALLTHLSRSEDERNYGSLEPTATKATEDMPPTQNHSPSHSSIFKEYTMDNGETLKLTRVEFDLVVDLFRLLHQQSQKIGNSGPAR